MGLGALPLKYEVKVEQFIKDPALSYSGGTVGREPVWKTGVPGLESKLDPTFFLNYW